MTFDFILWSDDGEETKWSLPAKFIICPTCEGRGTHVNRAIDGNGLSAEDFAEDTDFHESYMRGDYDVQCEECHGERVIATPDIARMSYAEKRALVRHNRLERQRRQWEYEDRRCRAMESGERY
jgi:hypothetical protein